MSESLDCENVSFHFISPPKYFQKAIDSKENCRKSILNYGSNAPASVRSCWVFAIGREVALERLPALVVVLIQTIAGLEAPFGNSHT